MSLVRTRREMAPQACEEQTDEGRELVEAESEELLREEAITTYEDIVDRIDQFLASAVPSDVRNGTKLRIRESLGVIQKALNVYGYSYCVQTLTQIQRVSIVV